MVLPLSLVVPAIVSILWLGGLSFQVNANDSELKKQSNTAERLARIEVTLDNNKEKIGDIKTEQRRHADKLDKILEKLSD